MLLKITKKTFFLLFVLLIACQEQPANEYQGYLSARYTQISSNASGKLFKLLVSRGDMVKTGTLLYQLDPMPEKSTLREAKADLLKNEETLKDLIQGQRTTVLESLEAQLNDAQANLTFQTKELARNKTLYKKQVIGLAEYQQVEAQFRSARAQVDKMKADIADANLGSREHAIRAQQAAVQADKDKIAAAQWSLSQKQQSSPVNALVFDTLFQLGEFIPLNQPVVSLIAPKDLLLIFFIPEPKLSNLSLGQVISFKMDGQDKHYKATIRYIYPNAEYTPPVIYSNDMRYKLVYRVEANINQSDPTLLHPGQPVDVFITSEKNP